MDIPVPKPAEFVSISAPPAPAPALAGGAAGADESSFKTIVDAYKEFFTPTADRMAAELRAAKQASGGKYRLSDLQRIFDAYPGIAQALKEINLE